MWGVKGVSKKLQLSFGVGGGVKMMFAVHTKRVRALVGTRILIAMLVHVCMHKRH